MAAVDAAAPPGFGHTSVLRDEAMALLAPRSGGHYCDLTVGGGGHSEAILEGSSPDGTLLALDRDGTAIEASRQRLHRFGARVTLVQSSFDRIVEVVQRLGAAPVDGFLLDLGVSSPQLDRAERGFSFSADRDGPLDMRMDRDDGQTAADLLRRVRVDELTELLRTYGEERYAGRIARAICEAAQSGQLDTTGALAAVISRAVPPPYRYGRIHPATRTFQALRIAVNDELGQLQRFLEAAPGLLADGGKVVIVAFHSLEDRIVKHRFRALAQGGGFRALTKKPIVASDAEVERNPRARSAKLRAIQRSAP
jgi:16S rRNA (cytosine1402-N4)-methyltransferase